MNRSSGVAFVSEWAAWLTWHLQAWLTRALAEARQVPVPALGEVRWPGTVDAVRAELNRLVSEWNEFLVEAASADLDQPTLFPWPDPRPLHRLIAWVNMEMMKNAAELGVVVNSAIIATEP